MTGRQPAEHRARILRQFPLWSIRPVDAGVGWTAKRPEHANIWAVSLADLEVQLSQAEGGRHGPRTASAGVAGP